MLCRLVKLFHKLCLFSLLSVCLPAESMTVYGHRGARGLAPENTLPGFKVALKHRVDYIDVDVVMTKDRVLVAYHDLTLNPNTTRDAHGNWVEDKALVVKELTLEELQTYDVSQVKPFTRYASIYTHQIPTDKTAIPTLRAVIRAMKAQADYPIGFQIELKTDPTQPNWSASPAEMVQLVERVVREEGVVDRTKVQAYDWRCLLLLQQLNPRIETAYLTDVEHEKVLRDKDPAIAGLWTAGHLLKNYHDSVPEMIKSLGGTWWDVEDIGMTQALLDEAHRLNLKVATWSDSDKTGLDIDIPLTKHLIDMQVEGIITDRPDVVKLFCTEFM